MLYLAEVQKQKGGLLGGGGKAELKLLAAQKNDQVWNPIADEVITAEEANKLNDGALVLVELNQQRQVQRIQEAGRPLVNILQNFSRQLEKLKSKEEEIDQWKESLTFQGQELSRREMEMDERSLQLQQMESELQRFESEKNLLETSRSEFEALKQEVERNRQELEGAWEHLRGEQRRLEERQAELQQGSSLDSEQARALSDLLERLSTQVAPTELVREHVNYAFEMLEAQQTVLNPCWQQLDEQQSAVDEQQAEFERLFQEFSQQQAEWEQVQGGLNEQIAELKVNTATLETKQEYAQALKEQLRHTDDLYQQIQLMASLSDSTVNSELIDLQALENMPIEELEQVVKELQEKSEIDANFVDEQEQELKYKQDTIEELQQKLKNASDSESHALETELADEKDHYQMLNETLVGQRRSLVERQLLLKQHQAVLRSRLGKHNPNEQYNSLDLTPIVSEIDQKKQILLEKIQKIENDIEEIRTTIDLSQGAIENLTQEQETKRQQLKTLEEYLASRRTVMAESRSKVHLYGELLQPIQNNLDGLRQKLEGVVESLGKVQETGDYQLHTITEMQQAIANIVRS